MEIMEWWQWFIWWFVLLLILVPGWVMTALVNYLHRKDDVDDDKSVWQRVPTAGWILITAIIGWLVLWIVGGILSWGTFPAAVLLFLAFLIWIFLFRDRDPDRPRNRRLAWVMGLALLAEAVFMITPVVEHWWAKTHPPIDLTLTTDDWQCTMRDQLSGWFYTCDASLAGFPPTSKFMWQVRPVHENSVPEGTPWPMEHEDNVRPVVDVTLDHPVEYEVSLYVIVDKDQVTNTSTDIIAGSPTNPDATQTPAAPTTPAVTNCNQVEEGSWRYEELAPNDQEVFPEGPGVIYDDEEAAEAAFISYVENTARRDVDNLKLAIEMYLQSNEPRDILIDPDTGCASGYATTLYNELIAGASRIVDVLDVIYVGEPASYDGQGGSSDEVTPTPEVPQSPQSTPGVPPLPPTDGSPSAQAPAGTSTSSTTVVAVAPRPAPTPAAPPAPQPPPPPPPAPVPPPVPQVEPAPDVPDNGNPGDADGVGSGHAGGTISPG